MGEYELGRGIVRDVRSDEQFQGAIKEIMTSGSVKIRSEQIWTCSFAASNPAYTCEVQLVCELSKKGNRPSIAISPYLAGHISSLLVLLDTSFINVYVSEYRVYGCSRIRLQRGWP